MTIPKGRGYARSRWSLVPLFALAASCAEPAATPLDPSLRLDVAADPFAGEVIINDEEWRGPEEPEAEGGATEGASASFLAARFSVNAAAATEPEPMIRIGVIYSELKPTRIRMGGQTDEDLFELRQGSPTGPVLAAGLSGEVVATMTTTTPRQIRIAHAGLPGGAILSSGPIALVSQSGIVRLRRFLSDRSLFRGAAEVRFNRIGSHIVGINQLPIEQYVRGVVPNELGPLAYPLLEAQKSQAVTARTYARRRMQFCPALSRCGHGYHMVPTTTDQVYSGFRRSNGVRGEYDLSNQAVDETRGIVATYRGGLIDALYSSTSGGWTANSEDVYSAVYPYARGVPDHERGRSLQHVPTLEVFRNHGNPTNLRNHANGDFEADWSRYHRWYVDWTVEEMRQVVGRIRSAKFIDPGEVYAVNVLTRSGSGRVREMEFLTEKRGRLVATKDAVRSALRYVTYKVGANGAITPVFNSLRSTLVYVEPVIDPKTKKITGWEAWGGGWGHGVGMSQTGAVGMAEKGYTYDRILGHYYQNSTLQKRWN